MNKFYKEYEMLSAYIDGELTKEEVKYIEDKLAVSKDLQQKTKLAGLYTENLKPLFITAGLTNEDIFDFALYRKLPLDKERGQYLMIGSNEDGSNYFEIKTASIAETNNDFEKFVAALNLNKEQKMQIDSILESYADDMQEQILVNENNTVAISPKLWNYNKAIFADIMPFAKDANGEHSEKID